MVIIFTFAQLVPSFVVCLTPPSGIETIHVVLVACRLIWMAVAGVVAVKTAYTAIVAVGSVWVFLLLAAASFHAVGAQCRSLD